MNDYMLLLLHKWSELRHLHISAASDRPVEPQAERRGSGKKSSVDLDGHEKGQILCSLNRLAFMWWTILFYLILCQWHPIYNVRLFSGRFWKTKTAAAMQPVDWASVLCIGGMNQTVQTHKWACSAVQQGWWEESGHPQPLLRTSIMTVCWQHHLA